MNADEKYSSIGVHLRSSAASNVPFDSIRRELILIPGPQEF